MQHGRDHQERQHKVRRPRRNNVPPSPATEPDVELEADLLSSGRGDARPREGVVGAHLERGFHSDTGRGPVEGQEPVGAGSEVAPTAQAAQREQERHRREEEIGRFAAGTGGRIRDMRDGRLTREALDQASGAADEAVGASLEEPGKTQD
jgi:hypothetical protein